MKTKMTDRDKEMIRRKMEHEENNLSEELMKGDSADQVKVDKYKKNIKLYQNKLDEN